MIVSHGNTVAFTVIARLNDSIYATFQGPGEGLQPRQIQPSI